MTPIAWTFLRAGGRFRPVLLAASSAVATALLLVAVAIASLPARPREGLFNLVAERGLRGGTTFATVLLALPILLMVYQVVRLGTANRERRLAALRLAGATPGQVRRVGMAEVGLPVAAGALLGPLGYLVLRGVLGGDRSAVDSYSAASPLDLVPTTVTPAWWQVALVIVLVTGAGTMTGALASRHVVATPLGTARRASRPAPRPWAALLSVLAGFLLLAGALLGRLGGDAVGMAGILLVVVGLVLLSPWVAYRSGVRAARRTSSPATLVAAARLVGDPRPAGRAAAAVGAIGLVSGASAALEAEVFAGSGSPGIDPFFVASFLLVGAGVLLALVVTTTTLAIHAAETMIDRKRALAALVAAGTPLTVLRDSLRQEARLTALPLAVGGAVLGAAAVGAAAGQLTAAGVLIPTGQIVATILLTWLAIQVSARAVAPVLARVAAPENLRTE